MNSYWQASPHNIFLFLLQKPSPFEAEIFGVLRQVTVWSQLIRRFQIRQTGVFWPRIPRSSSPRPRHWLSIQPSHLGLSSFLLFFLWNLLGWHQSTQFYRFPVHNSTAHPVYAVWCVHRPHQVCVHHLLSALCPPHPAPPPNNHHAVVPWACFH